jgi:hypothetical protein
MRSSLFVERNGGPLISLIRLTRERENELPRVGSRRKEFTLFRPGKEFLCRT